MKKRHYFLLLFAIFLTVDMQAQRYCTKCNGLGRIKTRYDIASYGNIGRKIKCQYCQQWINASSAHWDTCPVCQGSGRVGSSQTSRNDRNTTSTRSTNDIPNLESYLDPLEVQAMNELMKMRMKGTKTVIQTCSPCGGSGSCRSCGGTGHFYAFGLDQACPACLYTGRCQTCMGQGQSFREVKLSQQELDELDRKIKYYTDKATSNMH